jgi:hypothetical protein
VAREPGTRILRFDAGMLLSSTESTTLRGARMATVSRKRNACIEACSKLVDERFSKQLAEERTTPRMDMEMASLIMKHALGVPLESVERLRVTQRAKPQKLARGEVLHCDNSRVIILEGAVEVLLRDAASEHNNDGAESFAHREQCVGHLSTADSCGVTTFAAGADNDGTLCTLRCRTDVLILRVHVADVLATRSALERGHLQSAAIEAFLQSRVLQVHADSPPPSRPELDTSAVAPSGDSVFLTSSDVFAMKSTELQAPDDYSSTSMTVAAPVVHPLSSPRIKPALKARKDSNSEDDPTKPVTLFFKRVLNGVGKYAPKQKPTADEAGPAAKSKAAEGLPRCASSCAGDGSRKRGNNIASSRRLAPARGPPSVATAAAAAPPVDLMRLRTVTEESRALRPSVPTGARRMRVQQQHQQWRRTGTGLKSEGRVA